MNRRKTFSADGHIVEPPDLWTSRIDAKYKDRCPRVINVPEGQMWVVDDVLGSSFIQGSKTGQRFDQPERSSVESYIDAFENVRPGAYIPEEALKDMDIDGIDVHLVYPTTGLQLMSMVKDSDFLSACFRAYNDFAADYCKANPERLKAVAFLNVDDIDEAVTEMERCAKMGMIGAAIPVFTERRRYFDPAYDKLWAAAQDMRFPISLHIATNRPGPNADFKKKKLDHVTRGTRDPIINADYWVRMSFCDFIFSGVFERFPSLRVGSVEHGMHWTVFFVSRLDYHYNQSAFGWMGHRFKENMLPTDYFHRNIWVATQEDGLEAEMRGVIQVENILWGNDYPHTESSFPKSQEFLAKILEPYNEDEKNKIAWENASKMYSIN